MFKVGVFLDKLKKYSLNIYESSLKAYNNAKKDNTLMRIPMNVYLNFIKNVA